MGRYSFFIFGSVASCGGFSAYGESSSDIYTGTGNDRVSTGIRDIAIETILRDNPDLLKQEKNSEPEKLFEEKSQDSGRVSLFDFVGGGGSSGGGGASLGSDLDSIRGSIKGINKWIDDHNKWAGNLNNHVDNINNSLQSQINGLKSWQNSHDAWAGRLANRVGALESWQRGHDIWANNLSNRVTYVDNRVTNTNNRVTDVNDRVTNVYNHFTTQINNQSAQLNTHTNQINFLNTQYSSSVSWLQNIYDKLNTMNSNVASNHGKIISWLDSIFQKTDTINSNMSAGFSSNGKKMDALLSKLDTTNSNMAINQLKMISWLESIFNKLDTVNNNMSEGFSSNGKKLDALLSKLDTTNSNMAINQLKMISWLESIFNKLDTVNNNMSEGFRVNASKLDAIFSKLDTTNSNIASNHSKMLGWLESIFNKLDTTNSNMSAGFRSNGSKLDTVAGKLNDLLIANGLIGTSVLLVKESLDTFKNSFVVAGEDGLNAHDGIFVRMLKKQFLSLRNDLSKLFKDYFGEDSFKKYFGVQEDGTTLAPTGMFSKYLGDQIYKIRYTTISEFDELRTFLKGVFSDLLASGNTTNQWLDLTYQSFGQSLKNQVAIAQWLKSIFEKPYPSVVIPPFDFDRLEQLLKKMSFGEITNESGTNFWDFMKSLMDNLGDIIGKGIDGLVSILQKILDILDGLIDTLLSLVIPKNWDFLDNGFGSLKDKFDVKFKVFLDLGGLVKNLFKPNKQDFLKAISFTWFGANFDFTKSQSSLDIYVPKFRLAISVFIWAITAIYIYRKITGTGDVINDS